MKDKYQLPDFLNDRVDIKKYRDWLDSKAKSLRKRDSSRKGISSIPQRARYKEEIHETVRRSEGKDAYTGEQLDWELIGKYNNVESKRDGRNYWARLKNLPSVDHASGIPGKLDFEICGLQTNDSKSWLSYSEFVEFCKRVIRHSKSRRRK